MANMPGTIELRLKLVTRYGEFSWWRTRIVVWVAKVLRVPLDVVEDDAVTLAASVDTFGPGDTATQWRIRK